jgi:hypothetical protein
MKINTNLFKIIVIGTLIAAGLSACGKAQAQTGGGLVTGGGKLVTGGKEARETDFIYKLNKAGDGVIITGHQEELPGGALVIPSKIEGYPVVAIDTSWEGGGFYYLFDQSLAYIDNRWNLLSDAQIKAKGLRPYITSIVFPDTITELKTQLNLGKLTSIVFPKNLKEIPAEFGASDLTAIKWPETLEIIGRSAFQGAEFTELVIPEGVKEIRDSAFSGCKKLTTLTLPSSIEKIGAHAFQYCEALTTVKIPAKTIYYGNYEDGRWGHSMTPDSI